MKLLSFKLPSTHDLFFVGDMQEGNALVSHHCIAKMVKIVRSKPTNRVVLMGDLADAIEHTDKRYSRATTDTKTPVPLLQYQAVVEMLKPLKGRILCALEGNHDYGIAERFGDMVKDYVCKELSTEYGTYMAKLSVCASNGKLLYKIFVTHGGKTITSCADDPIRVHSNMCLRLKRLLKNHAADAVIMGMGHAHKLLVQPPVAELFLTDDTRRVHEHYTQAKQTGPYIHPDLRYYFCSGSFLKGQGDGVSGYAERKQYDPTEIGFVAAHIEDGTVTGVEKIVL